MRPPTPTRSAVAIGAVFFVNGATFANWLPRIPEVRDELGISNAGLGATLLGGGLGGIVGAALVGPVVTRLGSHRLLVVAATALAVGMPAIAFVPSAPALMVVLTVLGVLDVGNDVAMNALGSDVQHQLGRSIMQRLHAMWSLGFTAGAVAGSVAAASHVGVEAHLLGAGAVLLATVLVSVRAIAPSNGDPVAEPGPHPVEGSGPAPVRWGVVALVVAAVGAIGLEQLPNDWAAVLLRDVHDAGRFGGAGTAVFAAAMLAGRLGGDHVIDRVGEHALLTWASSLALAGVVVTVTAPASAVVLAGLATWGLGVSVVFPQLYASAARQPGRTTGAAMGPMVLGQRAGAMAVAGLTGLLADGPGLRAAFAVVGAGSAALVLAATRRGQRLPR